MAIIKEYNSGGTTIKIADDFMPKTEEENKLAYALLDEVARRICEGKAKRDLEESMKSEREEISQKIMEG